MQPLDAQKAVIQELEKGASSFNSLADNITVGRELLQECLDKLEKIGVVSSSVVGIRVMYHLCSAPTVATREANAESAEPVLSVPAQVRELLVKAGDKGLTTADLAVQGTRGAVYAALQHWKKKERVRSDGTRWYWVKPKVSIEVEEDKPAPAAEPEKLKDGAVVLGRAVQRQKPARMTVLEPVTASVEMSGLVTIRGYGHELILSPENACQLGDFLRRAASVALMA